MSHVMPVLYFAYGSNLCHTRLTSRVRDVVALGAASLAGYELRWHKRSVDGSGKCSIKTSDTSSTTVHGALYRMSTDAKRSLDGFEGLGIGYTESKVWVASVDGPVQATTYVASATHIDASLRPYSWYRELVVRGAEAHELPPIYLSRLREVEVWEDPDPTRAADNLRTLPCASSGR